MATRIKLRRDTAANWLAQNPILAQGETGFETDSRAMKLGDGATHWADLKYAVTGDLKVTDDTIHGDMSVSLSSGIGNRENWILLTQANYGDVQYPDDAESTGVGVDSQGNTFASYWLNGGGTGLQKISPSGEVLWNNWYDEYNTYGWGMVVDKNDDVILILSETDSTSDDILLVKVSGLDGSITWQKYINSYGDNNDYASCIDTDSHGNIIITGQGEHSGPDNNNAAYVAKFAGTNGSLMWSKQYDIDLFDSTGTGLAVDKDDNIGIVGTSYGPGNFVNLFKLNGTDGSILWQGKILNVKWDNGNNDGGINGDIHFADITSSDVAADAQGNFYLTFNWNSPYYPGVTALVAKFNATTGKTMWARWLSWDDLENSSGSLICDELNNVYVSSTLRKYKNNYDVDNSLRPTTSIIKINATGSIVWQRWLSSEQAVTLDAKDNMWNLGQSIAVIKDYVVVTGNYYYVNDYSNDNQNWDTQPYVAKLSRDGTEFDVSGWKFVDSSNGITSRFASVITDADNYEYDNADITNFQISVTSGDVSYELNSDTSTLVYINKSNVNKVTFEEKTLTLPKGGAIDIGREKLGYISAIGGGFYGQEGWNNQGNVWLNGNDRDEKGATYSAGGWYTYDTWNDYDDDLTVPMVFKTDSEGKLIWQAGNALDQDWSSPDLVDVVYHQQTNTVVALGNDGELDGHEGFNILYLDADTGSMKQDITHIRPAEGSNDIDPRTLDVMSNGSPVVSGYITGANATYADVTEGTAGLTGSSASGTLVVLKSKFTVDTVTEYPQEDGTWYLYPAGAQIYSVNRYGHDESYPTIAYTGTLGSGARVDATVAGRNPTAVIALPGSGYKAGQQIKVLGTSFVDGATPSNDMYLFIDSVDVNGGITGFNGAVWDTDAGAIADTTFTGLATVAVAGTGLQGWTQYAPEGTAYTLFNRASNGTYYGVGDTFKILGTALGGASPANDLTITVTTINGTGAGGGQVTDVSLSGTPQSTTIKLYGGSADYTQTGTYNVRHELSSDGFIWTPTWSKVFGSSGDGYLYDSFTGLTLDSSDNVIVSGYSDGTGLNGGTTIYGNYNQTGIITKFDSTGTILWTKSIDGSEGHSTVWGVATDSEDNIFSVMSSSDASNDPYITKLDSDGNYLWQQSINVWNSDAWAISVASNGDVMIVGECWNEWFYNDYHNRNNNLLVVKFDKDGNKLFARTIWSTNGVRFNNNSYYSNQLTIKDDRFSIAAYSYDPGDSDSCGIVIDLPLDGTGVGDYGNFHYEEVETHRGWRFETNSYNGRALATDVTNTIITRPYVFVDAPYVDADAWRNVSIYGDRVALTQTIYKPEGGEVKGIAKITFEDGSVQTSSMQGLPQVNRSQVNGGSYDYWVRPEDNGKHILQVNSNTVYIPSPGRVYLPVGFAFTIINKGNNSGVATEDYDEDIYLSGGAGENAGSYEIPEWSMATLVKMQNGQWMIAGSGLSSGW
jgi:hypothetical protein